jgi:hypothetical protein
MGAGLPYTLQIYHSAFQKAITPLHIFKKPSTMWETRLVLEGHKERDEGEERGMKGKE